MRLQAFRKTVFAWVLAGLAQSVSAAHGEGKGLGLALMKQTFGEFYKRGIKTVGLGVDAENPTGATRLYQKVGMHPASEHVTYEKELRAGRNVDEE